MKILFIISIIFAFSISLNAQDFVVSKVVGSVYNNNTLIKKGDKIKSISLLRSENTNAALRLISPEKGTIPISFAGGKRIINKTSKTHSDLYELVLADYVKNFTEFQSVNKSMKTRGSSPQFDIIDYFNDFNNKSKNQIVILEDQKIPYKSKKMILSPTDHLFAIIYKNAKDTLKIELPVIQDSIVFDIFKFPKNENFKWKVKRISLDNENHLKESDVTNTFIYGTTLTVSGLERIIDLLNVDTSKSPNKELSKKDISDYINFNYGTLYEPALAHLLNMVK